MSNTTPWTEYRRYAAYIVDIQKDLDIQSCHITWLELPRERWTNPKHKLVEVYGEMMPYRTKTPNGFVYTYTISINPMERERRDVLVTLAHELRHVWQYHTGRLSWKGDETLWRPSPLWDWRPITGTYQTFPWELDATRWSNEWFEKNVR